jgi:hypothetical protein
MDIERYVQTKFGTRTQQLSWLQSYPFLGQVCKRWNSLIGTPQAQHMLWDKLVVDFGHELVTAIHTPLKWSNTRPTSEEFTAALSQTMLNTNKVCSCLLCICIIRNALEVARDVHKFFSTWLTVVQALFAYLMRQILEFVRERKHILTSLCLSNSEVGICVRHAASAINLCFNEFCSATTLCDAGHEHGDSHMIDLMAFVYASQSLQKLPYALLTGILGRRRRLPGAEQQAQLSGIPSWPLLRVAVRPTASESSTGLP